MEYLLDAVGGQQRAGNLDSAWQLEITDNRHERGSPSFPHHEK